MDDNNEDMPPPFWLQTNENLRRHRRRQPPSFLLNSGVLLIVLVVIAFVFVFVIIPTFRNFTSQILSPNSVRKGWDSLNILLVLFAIVCGFLSRNNNNNSNSTEDNNLNSTSTPTRTATTSSNSFVGYQDQDRALLNAQKLNFSNPNGWYDEYLDRGAALSYRMRSSRSYSDLREQSLWVQSDNQWRFYDDTHLQSFNLSNSDQLGSLDGQLQREQEQKQESEDSNTESVAFHAAEQVKEVVHASPVVEVAPSPVPPPLPADDSVSQLYKSVVKEKGVNKEREDAALQVDVEAPLETAAPPPTRGHKTKRRSSRRTYADVAQEEKAEPEMERPSETLPPPPPPPPLQRRRKHKVRNVEPSLLPEVGTPPQEEPVDVVEVKIRTRRSYEDVSRANIDENDFRVESFQHERARGKHRATRSSEDFPFREELEREEIRNSGHKNEKKRGNATKELLNFLSHQRRKKKKQRQRSVENFENLVSSESSLQYSHIPPPSPPPPPPPPPPPSSLFHNWLHRKGKPKKVHTVDPLHPRVGNTTKRPSKTRTQVALSQVQPNQVPTARPPLPGKTQSYFAMDDNPSSGNESPLLPIPPPPPPPPFKMPGWKFLRQGDFVRVSSFNSSRSSSPDLDDLEATPRKEGNASATTSSEMQSGGSSQQASFCPSPDVNTKADMFIERVRAGFKNEKAKSFEEKQHAGGRKSRLSRQASLDEVGSGQ